MFQGVLWALQVPEDSMRSQRRSRGFKEAKGSFKEPQGHFRGVLGGIRNASGGV